MKKGVLTVLHVDTHNVAKLTLCKITIQMARKNYFGEYVNRHQKSGRWSQQSCLALILVLITLIQMNI